MRLFTQMWIFSVFDDFLINFEIPQLLGRFFLASNPLELSFWAHYLLLVSIHTFLAPKLTSILWFLYQKFACIFRWILTLLASELLWTEFTSPGRDLLSVSAHCTPEHEPHLGLHTQAVANLLLWCARRQQSHQHDIHGRRDQDLAKRILRIFTCRSNCKCATHLTRVCACEMDANDLRISTAIYFSDAANVALLISISFLLNTQKIFPLQPKSAIISSACV